MDPNDADRMANSVDPDQTAPLGAVWSGSALFAQAYLSDHYGINEYITPRCLAGYKGIKHIFCSNFLGILSLMQN